MSEKQAGVRMTWFGRLPTLARGVALVIAVTAAGIVPPTVLDEMGVRLTPRLPWVAPVATAWMWLVWRFVSRPGWRREHLCVRPLLPRQWMIAVAVLAVGTGAIHAVRMASLRWLAVPDVRLPDVSRYSMSVLLSSFLVTALAAGIFEEAAYRGYLRSVLEERHGWKWAVALSAGIFALAHANRGSEFYVVLPSVFLFGCLYSVVAWRTGSIWPGIVVHTSYNLVRLVQRWLAQPTG